MFGDLVLKCIFYFTKNFRKVIEIDNSANESTITHFYDYKMINNVKPYEAIM